MIEKVLSGIFIGFLPGFHPNMLPNLGFPKEAVIPAVVASYLASKFYNTNFYSPALSEPLSDFHFEILSVVFSLAFLNLLRPIVERLIILIDSNRQILFFLLLLAGIISISRAKKPLKYLTVFLISGFLGMLFFKLPEPQTAIMVYFSSFFFLNLFIKAERGGKREKGQFLPRALMAALSASVIASIPALTPMQGLALARLVFGPAPISPLAYIISTLQATTYSLEAIGKGRTLLTEYYGGFSFPFILPYFVVSLVLLLPLYWMFRRSFKSLTFDRRVLAIFPMLYIFAYSGGYFPLVLPSMATILLAREEGVEPSALLGFLLLPTILFYSRYVF